MRLLSSNLFLRGKTGAQDVLFRYGRSAAWRCGRWLSAAAHGHTTNDMSTNGERRLQTMIIELGHSDSGRITFCDIGANVGDWSAQAESEAHRIGAKVEIHAFEPVPASADRYRQRFTESDLEVHLHQIALSDQTGSSEMAIFSETGGTNSLAVDATTLGSRLKVDLTTFDNWRSDNNVEEIALIKIDAEGHDAAVLRGAVESMRARAIGVAQFEYNHRWMTSRAFLRDAFAIAESVGYKVGQVHPKGIELYEEWHFELEDFVEANYALIRPDLLKHLSHWSGQFDASNTFVVRN